MTFRDKLTEGRPLVGTLVTLPAPDLAEALSCTGLDWLFFDMEHTSLSLSDVKVMMQAMDPGCLSFIRIPAMQEMWVKQALDAGCDGIIVPMVNTGEDARRVTAWAKYPPEGQRSVGITRAQGYGEDFAACVKNANKDTAVILQIEHREAVGNIDDILSVPHVDGIFIGPYDLSGSLGIPGQVGDTKVQDAIAKARAAAKKAGVPVGIFSATPEGARKEIAAGAAFVAVGIDVMLMTGFAKSLCAALKTDKAA